jgi:hypothetical protein
MKLNYSLLFVFMIVVFGSCDTVKHLQIADGSKSDGTLTMFYEHTRFQKPIVQWDIAKKNAITKCQAWGYKNAEFFDVGTSNCIGYDTYGNCTYFRVIYKCQCTN